MKAGTRGSYFFLVLLGLIFLLSCQNEPTDLPQTITDEKSDGLLKIFIYEGANGINWKSKKPCSIQLCDTCELLDAKIKFRGGISSGYHKHSFSVKFAEAIQFENWPKDRDYILNASYIDKTLARHRLNFEIFNAMSPKNSAANCTFAELYLNDFYQGIYVIMEEIDASKLGMDKNDTNAILVKDGMLFVSDRANFVPQEENNPFQQKIPKINVSDQQNELNKLWHFLHTSSDQYFSDSVVHYFDLNSVLDWHLLLLLSNNTDGSIKNFYWYRKSKHDKWKVVPWDCDHTFGRSGAGELNRMEIEPDWERNALLYRLYINNVNGYNQKMATKWMAIRSDWMNEAFIQDKLAQYEKEIGMEAFERNFKKWPINDTNYSDPMNYQEEINLINDFAKKRLVHLDSLFTTWATL